MGYLARLMLQCFKAEGEVASPDTPRTPHPVTPQRSSGLVRWNSWSVRGGKRALSKSQRQAEPCKTAGPLSEAVEDVLLGSQDLLRRMFMHYANGEEGLTPAEYCTMSLVCASWRSALVDLQVPLQVYSLMPAPVFICFCDTYHEM